MPLDFTRPTLHLPRPPPVTVVVAEATVAPPVAEATAVEGGAPIAVAVPVDDDGGEAFECERAVAHLRMQTLQVRAREQKLLNYRKSVTVYCILDILVTLFAWRSGAGHGGRWWARFCLVFLGNPLVGYAGAKTLNASIMACYLWLCSLKEIYILVLFALHATGSFLFFVFVVQLWITTVSYKLWRLLAPVEPSRARALAGHRRRTALVLF